VKDVARIQNFNGSEYVSLYKKGFNGNTTYDTFSNPYNELITLTGTDGTMVKPYYGDKEVFDIFIPDL
jgi:hypothetical protein